MVYFLISMIFMRCGLSFHALCKSLAMKVSDPLRRILRESSSLKSTVGDKDGNVMDRLILLCIYGCRTYEESNIFHTGSIHAILPIRGSSAAVCRPPIRSLSRLFFFFYDHYNGRFCWDRRLLSSLESRPRLTECKYTGKHVAQRFPAISPRAPE